EIPVAVPGEQIAVPAAVGDDRSAFGPPVGIAAALEVFQSVFTFDQRDPARVRRAAGTAGQGQDDEQCEDGDGARFHVAIFHAAEPPVQSEAMNSCEEMTLPNSGRIFSHSRRCTSGSGLAQQSSRTLTVKPASSA